jgi:hypothetical protein
MLRFIQGFQATYEGNVRYTPHKLGKNTLKVLICYSSASFSA